MDRKSASKNKKMESSHRHLEQASIVGNFRASYIFGVILLCNDNDEDEEKEKRLVEVVLQMKKIREAGENFFNCSEGYM